MKGDLAAGIITAILSALYLTQTYSIKIFGGDAAVIDARTVPKIWGAGLLILSIMLIIRSVLRMRREKSSSGTLRNVIDAVKNRREVVYTFALLILYAALMEPLGFVISSILYVFLQIWTLTPIDKRSSRMKITAACLSLFFSVGLYYLFTEYFMVLLPEGILSF